MRRAGHVARMGDRRQAHRGLVGRPGGKKIPLGRQSKSKFVLVNATKAQRESQATSALTSVTREMPALRPDRLTPQKPVSTDKTGWVPQTVWTLWKHLFSFAGFEHRTGRPAA